MSDTDSDVYRCEDWFVFAQCMCVLFCFQIDVTAVKCLINTLVVHLRNAKYVLQLYNCK